MAGRPGRPSFGGNPDELKPRAEELLREFAASIGAIFLDSPEARLFVADDQRRRIQALAVTNERDSIVFLLRDKAAEAGEQGSVIRARMFDDAADLIEGKE